MVTDYEEEAGLVFWLTERFEDVGIEIPLAIELAIKRRDWHKAQDLIEAGCDPQLAGRIIL